MTAAARCGRAWIRYLVYDGTHSSGSAVAAAALGGHACRVRAAGTVAVTEQAPLKGKLYTAARLLVCCELPEGGRPLSAAASSPAACARPTKIDEARRIRQGSSKARQTAAGNHCTACLPGADTLSARQTSAAVRVQGKPVRGCGHRAHRHRACSCNRSAPSVASHSAAQQAAGTAAGRGRRARGEVGGLGRPQIWI